MPLNALAIVVGTAIAYARIGVLPNWLFYRMKLVIARSVMEVNLGRKLGRNARMMGRGGRTTSTSAVAHVAPC